MVDLKVSVLRQERSSEIMINTERQDGSRENLSDMQFPCEEGV